MAIHEEARRPGQAEFPAFRGISPHRFRLLAGIQALVEAGAIQTQLARLLFELRWFKALVSKQQIVEFPELTLCPRTPRSFGRLLRIGVHGQWKVFEGKGQLAPELLLQLGEVRVDLLAVGTLVVGKFDQHDGRPHVAANGGVAQVNGSLGWSQANDDFGLAAQVCQILGTGPFLARFANVVQDLPPDRFIRLVAFQTFVIHAQLVIGGVSDFGVHLAFQQLIDLEVLTFRFLLQ